MLADIERQVGRTRRPESNMKLRHVAVLALTALVITSGATAAMAVQGNPLAPAAGSQHSSHDDVDREGDIDVTVAGNVTPGNEVTLTATLDDQPVRFASVTVNGQDVGETDANGTINATVPDADEFEIEVEAESEGELSIPLAEETEDDGDDRDGEVEDDDEVADDAEDDVLDVTVDGTVTPGSDVTIVATHEGYPVAGASVTVNGDPAGETDANGTVTTTVPDADEFEVEVELDKEGKLKVPLEEDTEDENEEEPEDENEDEREVDEGQIDLIVEGTLDPGENLSVTALHDGAPVTNATVAVNGDPVGETDANGSIEVQVPNSDELEIEVTADDLEAEMSVEFEDAEDGDHEIEEDDEAGEDDEETEGEDEGEHEAQS